MALRCAVRAALAHSRSARAPTTSTPAILAGQNAAQAVGQACSSSRSLATTARYSQRGDPYKVLTLEDDKGATAKALGAGEVDLKILFAPVNGADLEAIEGTGTSPPPLPAVPGGDAVAEVVGTGSGVKGLAKGDRVVPLAGSSIGTWRTTARAPAEALQKVPSDIPPEYASSYNNAAAAYRLLRDFATLKAGDVVIHSAANSAVGLAIVQMARKMGVKTISVVRSRPEEDDTMQVLTAVGGDIVVHEEYLHTPEFYALISDLPAPALALDAVGGAVAADLARALGNRGAFVSYGTLGGAPPRLPASVVSARGLKVGDFCIDKWTKGSTPDARAAMVSDIASMITSKELVMFFETHPFTQLAGALDRYYEPYKYRKVLLDMSV